MQRKSPTHLCIAALGVMSLGSFALSGCDAESEDITSDSLDSPFFEDGKADAAVQEGSPSAIGVLRVANESTKATLSKKVKLDKRAVDGIIALRAGPDKKLGTGDDVGFATLQQLDAVPYVGPSAFNKLLAYAKAHGFVPTPATLRGTVRISDGTPVVGGSVWVGHYVPGYGFDSSVAIADLDGEGRYSITVLSGTYDVSFRPKTDDAEFDLAAPAPVAIVGTVTQDATVPVVEIHGRVVDEDGEPAAGIVLAGYGKSGAAGAALNAVSDAEGRFTLSVVPAVYQDCSFFPYGAPGGSPYVRTVLGTLDFTNDAERAPWVVVRGAVVHGSVHYSDGTPVSGVVWIRHAKTSPTAEGTLDANGGYAIVVADGTYNIDVVAETAGARFTVRMAADRAITGDVTADGTIPVVEVDGRVVDQDGAPVGGVSIAGFAVVAADWCELQAVSDADGRFAVSVLPGVYQECALDPLDGTPYVDTALGTLDFTHDTTVELVVRR